MPGKQGQGLSSRRRRGHPPEYDWPCQPIIPKPYTTYNTHRKGILSNSLHGQAAQRLTKETSSLPLPGGISENTPQIINLFGYQHIPHEWHL